MMMFRCLNRAVLVLLCSCLISTGLAGCGALKVRVTEDVSRGERTDVTLLGTLTGDGIQEIEAVLAPFSDRSGITVDYQGTDAFTTLLPLAIAAGNAPDIALFPQPGLMADLVAEDQLIPLEDLVDETLINDALSPQWQNLGKFDDQIYGLPIRAYLKGLVWYLPERFAEQGYKVPRTWVELQDLTQAIIAAGETPWCLGVESGEASGWVGTDWIEDILLRQAGADTYDRWVNHEIPFTDSAVKEAFQTFGDLALDDQAVQGGKVGVISTSFTDSPQGLFQDPPGCYLHYQSNFISAFFPPDINVDEDVDVFLLPGDPARPESQKSIVVGAVQLAVLRDTPAVRALLEYLLTPESQTIWTEFGGHLSPYQQIDPQTYPTQLVQKQAAILQAAETVRFDASDAMPSAVGTGSFWSGVVDYLSGVDLDTVLRNIESTWPSS